MTRKKINKILWHGNDLNEDGSAKAPSVASYAGAIDGLNPGELYICDADGSPTLFIVTDKGRVVPIGGVHLDELGKIFLRKDRDDRSSGKISSDVGFEVGNFVPGASGGIFGIDKKTGQSFAELAKLRVRMKAYFESLEIVNTNSIGGRQVISPAGAVRLSMVFMPSEKYEVLAADGKQTEVTVPSGVYRCFFLAEQDGQEVDNRYKAGDQLQSKDFNITKPGEYNQVANHYYWRLVTGVSTQPVKIGELGYHYVDLSVTDCDTGSDSPAKGDVVAQLGNKNDVDRQNALVFSSVDTFSPSITLYQGINSYSLLGKEMVSYGVDKTSGKAFFNVYGDMYIGDRDNKSYVNFTQGTGVEVKGKLSIDSTIGDKNITEYIKENSGTDEETVRTIVTSITDDLQKQIDGTIETHFLSGVPTLNNLPASGWVPVETEANDETYDKHVGDLYYDKDTGYGYRFMKDGNTYTWELLKDTDVTKALANASKAQETADSKMKVFDHQPTDSEEYAVGDIWVNATYGNLYSNDILRAVKDKAAGASFNISHWTKASKYTDDSKAEEVQKNVDKLGVTVNNMNTTVNNMKDFTDEAFADGIVDRSEKSAIENYLNNIETTKAEVAESYGKVYGNALLEGVAKTNLANAYTAFGTAANELKTTINNAIADGVATSLERAAVDQKYTNFNTKYGEFIAYLNAANKYIQDKINANANKALEQVASLDYLKKALKEHTEITGGLIQSSMLALGYTKDSGEFTVMSGTNGIYDASKRGGGIASWWGGGMFDRFDYTAENMPANVATGLVRFDGTGYFANGNLWWDADGTIHADPQSFIINENQLGDYLELFQIRYKGDTKDIDYIIPQYPMQSLTVATEVRANKICIENGVLKWDEANQGFYVEKADGGKAGFYATSYVSAKGANPNSGGTSGGGLIQSVYGYGDLGGNFSDSDLTDTFNAYTINKLASRLSAVEKGAITSVSWSSITDKPSWIGSTKPSYAFSEITGKPTTLSGYGITDAKIAGGVITLGSNTITPITSHQSLANYVTLNTAQTITGAKTFSGGVKIVNAGGSWLSQKDTTACIYGDNYDSGGSAYRALLRMENAAGNVLTLGSIANNFGFWGYKSSRTDNGTDCSFYYSFADNKWHFGNEISGNAATATKLQTPRTINGTSFDGTSNITTAKWGTERTFSLTGSVTGSVSVDGSGNVFLATTYTENNISALDARFLKKSVFDDLFEKVNIGTSSSPVYAIRAKYGLYSDSFLSAKGPNPDAGGASSGIDETELWKILGGTGTEQISGTHLSSALSGYLKGVTVKLGTVSYASVNGVVSLPAYPNVTSLEWGNITGKPDSLKNPYPLEVTLPDGSTKVSYDGSVSKSIVLTRLYKSSEVTTATSDAGTVTPLAMNDWTKKQYVTALGTSGNYLTWTKNGVTNNITVPYATSTYRLNNLIAAASFGTIGVQYHSGGDFIVDGTGANNAISIPSSSVDAQYKNGQVLRLYYSSSYYTDILTSPNDHGAKTGLYYRQIVNNGAHEWRTLLDSKNYANFVTKVGTSTVGSGVKPIYLNAGVPTAFSSTVGGTAKPLYMNAGTLTALSATVGSATRPVYLNAGTITAGTYTFGNASGNAAVNNGTVNTHLNADLLDGIHFQNILERDSSGYSNIGTSGIAATGWFRIAETRTIDSGGSAFLLFIRRNYAYTNNEGYVFSINVSYSGGISITQLSGHANQRLITKIRVDYKPQSKAYIDFYVGTSVNVNTYYWFTVGNATSYTNATVVSSLTGTAYEFTTTEGCKSDRGFTGSFSGNASSATQLQTARTIWGQSFDGTGNVSGDMTGVGDITFAAGDSGRSLKITNAGSISLRAATSGWAWGIHTKNNAGTSVLGYSVGSYGQGNTLLYNFYGGTYDSPKMVILPSGNVGIGTTAPSQKLHVAGVIYSTTGIYSDGYVSSKGQNTSSDMRLKNRLRDISVDVRKIACAPSFEYTWKDGKGGIEAGSSAQYWENVLPQLVKTRGGYKEMAYGSIALLSAISLAKNLLSLDGKLLSVAERTETLEEKVKRLENENKGLKNKIRNMERRMIA